MAKPLMAKATAVWLVDNTTISFKQIADFVDLHELEVQGIADGDVAQGVKGFDPVANNQLAQEEIAAAESNPLHKLKLKFYAAASGEEKRRSVQIEHFDEGSNFLINSQLLAFRVNCQIVYVQIRQH